MHQCYKQDKFILILLMYKSLRLNPGVSAGLTNSYLSLFKAIITTEIYKRKLHILFSSNRKLLAVLQTGDKFTLTHVRGKNSYLAS